MTSNFSRKVHYKICVINGKKTCFQSWQTTLNDFVAITHPTQRYFWLFQDALREIVPRAKCTEGVVLTNAITSCLKLSFDRMKNQHVFKFQHQTTKQANIDIKEASTGSKGKSYDQHVTGNSSSSHVTEVSMVIHEHITRYCL